MILKVAKHEEILMVASGTRRTCNVPQTCNELHLVASAEKQQIAGSSLIVVVVLKIYLYELLA